MEKIVKVQSNMMKLCLGEAIKAEMERNSTATNLRPLKSEISSLSTSFLPSHTSMFLVGKSHMKAQTLRMKLSQLERKLSDQELSRNDKFSPIKIH